VVGSAVTSLNAFTVSGATPFHQLRFCGVGNSGIFVNTRMLISMSTGGPSLASPMGSGIFGVINQN